MPWSLYPQGKSPWYPLDRRLGRPQSQSACCGEEKYLAPAINLTPAIQSIASCLTDSIYLYKYSKNVLVTSVHYPVCSKSVSTLLKLC
jgi:hypothetical protein